MAPALSRKATNQLQGVQKPPGVNVLLPPRTSISIRQKSIGLFGLNNKTRPVTQLLRSSAQELGSPVS